ncbi:hypothetical protein BDW22DRAFT_464633 [Trametopsis cervina]|nr:hypothetical protein BDW22DRAFT_464633 [Trametopsis cervina]
MQDCLIAPSFRERWDSPEFCQRQERPFVWSDPAAPLLEYYGSCRDARIIDSITPFSVPHIIIHEAPDQTPWEACENRVVVPQNCAYLMVPGTPCHCPPVVPSQTEAAPELVVSTISDDDELSSVDSEADEEFESTTEESDSESALDTPKDGVFRFMVPDDIPSACPTFGHDFALEEDDDELPPFDDWYQEIAQRAH